MKKPEADDDRPKTPKRRPYAKPEVCYHGEIRPQLFGSPPDPP